MYRTVNYLKKHFGRKELAALGGSLLVAGVAVWLLYHAGNLEDLGYLGGFLAMLISSATVILPAPGIAVVAGLGAVVSSPLLLGLVAGIGATIGEITGYLIGYSGHNLAAEDKNYAKIAYFVAKYGFWAIVVLAFIPNPFFDLAGLVAGSTKYSIKRFLLATLIGKVSKCIVVAYAGALAWGWFA